MIFYRKRNWIFLIIYSVLTILNLNPSFSDENSDKGIKIKMSAAGKDLNRGTKKGIRKIQDKSCEVINGKTKCLPKKVKHSVENEMDKTRDAAY